MPAMDLSVVSEDILFRSPKLASTTGALPEVRIRLEEGEEP